MRNSSINVGVNPLGEACAGFCLRKLDCSQSELSTEKGRVAEQTQAIHADEK